MVSLSRVSLLWLVWHASDGLRLCCLVSSQPPPELRGLHRDRRLMRGALCFMGLLSGLYVSRFGRTLLVTSRYFRLFWSASNAIIGAVLLLYCYVGYSRDLKKWCLQCEDGVLESARCSLKWLGVSGTLLRSSILFLWGGGASSLDALLVSQ